MAAVSGPESQGLLFENRCVRYMKSLKVWVLPVLLVMLGLQACSPFATREATEQSVAGNPAAAHALRSHKSAATISKPDIDHRQYRYIRLANGMPVLLISDPSTAKAAASLDVNIGSGSDPSQRQGLAHFLEHMLFLGTQKYPDAADYQEFIKVHGGNRNAYTSFDHTNYFFDIDAGFLEPALDRFAQFFISPLIDPAYVDREINSVHSEYSSKFKSEFRRSMDAFKEVINEQHPYAKFAVGSLSSLKGDGDVDALQQDLNDFYHKYYSANLMSLVVLGQDSLDELEQMVDARFAAIKNHHTDVPTIEQPLFRDGSLPAELMIEPLKDVRQLSVMFPVPDVQPYYRVKPLSYIGNIVGHEGEGSLLSALKNEGLAEALSAGQGLGYRGESSFNVVIRLTEKGLQQRDRVLALLYQALAEVRDGGVQAWLYREQSVISDLEFRFQEQVEPIQYVSQLANNMHYYPRQDLLRGPYMMGHFDAALIRRYLHYLVPGNSLVTVNAKGLPVDKVSEHYATPYAFVPLDDDSLHHFEGLQANPDIHLPTRNRFLPEQLAMKPPGSGSADAVPERITEERNMQLWFKGSAGLDVPKGNVFFSVRSAHLGETRQQAAMAELYVRLLEDSLAEIAYPAQLAGLDYRISSHARGISIRIGGFSGKQGELLNTLLDALRLRHFDEQRFVSLKEDLLLQWQNESRQEPSQRALSAVRQSLYMPYWDEDELAQVLGDVSLEDLEDFVVSFWAAVEVDCLVNGNYTRLEARRLAGRIADRLALDERHIELPIVKVAALHSGEALGYTVNVDHSDSVYALYVQGADESFSAQADMLMAGQVLDSGFYQELRTEQQLGYIVWSSYMPMLTVPGMVFMVQSPSHNEETIDLAVNGFIHRSMQQFAQLDENTFEQHRQALLHLLREPPKSLSEASEEYWLDIALHYRNFDRKQSLITALENMRLPTWLKSYRNLFGDQRKALLIVSNDEGKAFPARVKERLVLQDLQAFKQQRAGYVYP